MAYNKYLKAYGRWKRLLLPSPAERRFKRMMGFWWYFYGMKREYPVAGYYVDVVTTRFHRVAIEVDGKKYHTDIIGDDERMQRIEAKGWSPLRIEAREILFRPRKTKRDTLKFIRRAP